MRALGHAARAVHDESVQHAVPIEHDELGGPAQHLTVQTLMPGSLRSTVGARPCRRRSARASREQRFEIGQARGRADLVKTLADDVAEELAAFTQRAKDVGEIVALVPRYVALDDA